METKNKKEAKEKTEPERIKITHIGVFHFVCGGDKEGYYLSFNGLIPGELMFQMKNKAIAHRLADILNNCVITIPEE